MKVKSTRSVINIMVKEDLCVHMGVLNCKLLYSPCYVSSTYYYFVHLKFLQEKRKRNAVR